MTHSKKLSTSRAKKSGKPVLQIKIWGTRGSLPSPQSPESIIDGFKTLFREFFDRGFTQKSEISNFLKELPQHRLGGYGGNTPCVEVTSPTHQVIIDGGSGIRALGNELMSGPCGQGKGEVHLMLTHFHWDHLIGIPLFSPIFIPGNQIHVYSPQSELPELFKMLFKKPYFPVPFEKLGAKIHFHILAPRKAIRFGDLTVTPYALDHPDPCWGYRFERAGKVFSHCVDTECTRVTREQLGADLPLYENVDLMIFDAQYTLMETLQKINWGHAAASLGIDIAMREGIKRVVFMHHDPASTDEKIAVAESQARQYYKSQLKSARWEHADIEEVDWLFAYDGMVLHLE